jgi:hypothetical protein
MRERQCLMPNTAATDFSRMGKAQARLRYPGREEPKCDMKDSVISLLF